METVYRVVDDKGNVYLSNSGAPFRSLGGAKNSRNALKANYWNLNREYRIQSAPIGEWSDVEG